MYCRKGYQKIGLNYLNHKSSESRKWNLVVIKHHLPKISHSPSPRQLLAPLWVVLQEGEVPVTSSGQLICKQVFWVGAFNVPLQDPPGPTSVCHCNQQCSRSCPLHQSEYLSDYEEQNSVPWWPCIMSKKQRFIIFSHSYCLLLHLELFEPSISWLIQIVVPT